MLEQTRKVYFSPYDDTTQAYVDFLKSATKKIRVADYSFNLQPVIDVLIQKHMDGLDVKLVLDRSQSRGPSESPKIKMLKAAGVPFVLGTSAKHEIMHNKYTVVDDYWAQYGSWNYTNPASDQDNFFVIENDTDIAKAFTDTWQKMWDWIVQNEPEGVNA